MNKTLVIGLGGTGSRVVNDLAKILHAKGEKINSDKMCCAVFDTNKNDIGSITASKTGLLIVPTSRPQKIKKYIDDYAYLGIEDWCPTSPDFLEESMIDGASEVRVKSRIAFLDCAQSELIKDLNDLLNEVIDSNYNGKVRIMIVSSLAGGTGSGMFIQVALWLRKKLSSSQISIRGIFLLPDIFINTVDDVRKNKTTQVRHYCNAYAAIRELNTLSKIKKNNSVELAEKITVGELFDSELDANSGVPVYDKAYFVDYTDENGVSLKSLGEYEQMVAQIVYMQMHEAMKDDIYSEEDNTFLATHESNEPLYCSCGTAKAVYPVKSVREYCILRAAQDSLSKNWKKIDNEITAMKERRAAEEAEGRFRDDVLDFSTEYIKIFDKKTSVDRKSAGKDRFFLSIANDVKNGKNKTGANDTMFVSWSDKVADFIKQIKKEKIDTTVAEYGGVDEYQLNEEKFVEKDRKADELIKIAQNSEADFEITLDSYDEKVEGYAEDLIDEIIPYSMGDINKDNKCSVYSLFVKNDPNGKDGFVHPVAARYMLYKLLAELRKAQRRIDFESSRIDGLSGGDVAKFFDNDKTAKIEKSVAEILKSKKWYQRKNAFIDGVESRYVQFINNKVALCQKYEEERLAYELFDLMIERVESLVEEMTAFFNNLDTLVEDLGERLAKNVVGTKDKTGKTLYVCGLEKHKKKIYESLDLGLDKSNSEINKSLINTVYGCFCAKERATDINNAPYVDMDIQAAFYSEMFEDFRKIVDDKNNAKKIDLDIYTAICREYDFNNENVKKTRGIDLVRTEDGGLEEEDYISMYNQVFATYMNTIFKKAAPFLAHDTEPTKNEQGCKTMRDKTFWGFNPAVSAACSDIGAILGISSENQEDADYLKSELYCLRAVYGIEAKYIPKFNELKGGKYYTCYKTVIDQMVQAQYGSAGEYALVSTPHLDKRWHKMLPYVSPEKQEEVKLEFYHTLWLAIAYGVIHTDKEGLVHIKRHVSGGFGSKVVRDEVLQYNGKKLTKTDVADIIEALREDQVFVSSDRIRVEAMFEKELKNMSTYIGTQVLQGLVTKNEDLNPINLVCRYNEANVHDLNVSAYLIGALEKIAKELAEKYNVDRSEEMVEEAKYRICKRIYDSSTRKKGKSEIFSEWEEAFTRLHII